MYIISCERSPTQYGSERSTSMRTILQWYQPQWIATSTALDVYINKSVIHKCSLVGALERRKAPVYKRADSGPEEHAGMIKQPESEEKS